MELNHICEELCKFVSANLVAAEVVVENESSLTDLGLDSFATIEIVLFIERKFGVVIPDDMLTKENISSVSALANCTKNLLGK